MPPNEPTQDRSPEGSALATPVSDPDTMPDMAKRRIAVHTKLDPADLKLVDRAADEDVISRSSQLYKIVRAWADAQRAAAEPKPKARRR